MVKLVGRMGDNMNPFCRKPASNIKLSAYQVSHFTYEACYLLLVLRLMSG